MSLSEFQGADGHSNLEFKEDVCTKGKNWATINTWKVLKATGQDVASEKVGDK